MNRTDAIATTALVISLLGGSTVGVAATDTGPVEEPAVLVRGTFQGGCPIAPTSESEADGVVSIRGITFACQRLEVSDPRLTGDNVYVGNWDSYRDAGFQLEAASWTLTNDDGAWVGTSNAMAVLGDGPHGYGDVATDIVMLAGTGAYDGLTAVLVIDWSSEPVMVVGAITDHGRPPAPGTE